MQLKRHAHRSQVARRRGTLRFAGAVLLLAGCGDNQDEAGARQLLSEVRAADYRSWTRAPGYETRRESSAPHSDAVVIHINAAVEDALLAEPGVLTEWPLGSVIVKDGWNG